MNFGAVDFITKPWNNRDFVAKIKRIINAAKPQPVKTLDEVEHQAILEAIKINDGKISQVAASLGITRQALYRRMEKFGIKL
jgi:DNA-binding NtrC family response regulator